MARTNKSRLLEASAIDLMARAMRRRQRDGRVRVARIERSAQIELDRWAKDLRAAAMEAGGAKSQRSAERLVRRQMDSLAGRLTDRMEPGMDRLGRWGWDSAARGHRSHMTLGQTREAGRRMLGKGREASGAVKQALAGKRLTKAQAARVQRELLFPDPGDERLAELTDKSIWGDGRTWQDRVDRVARLEKLDKKAEEVVRMAREGASVREINRKIREIQRGVERRVRTIARTEGLKTVEVTGREATKNLGGLVIGYRLMSVGDERVRELHAYRHGRLYARDSRGSYRAAGPPPLIPGEPEETEIMPIPPTAPNCRCYLLPEYGMMV